MSLNLPSDLTLTRWQAELINDRTSNTLYCHAGVGAGKTFAYVLDHAQWVLENKASALSWWLEPTHILISNAAVPEWRKYFNLRKWVDGKHYRIFGSVPQKIEIYHGMGTHTIQFLSADRPQYLVAANIGRLTIDEAGSIKDDVIIYASQRLRDGAANYTQAGILGAPQGMNHFADKANFEGIRKNGDIVERSFRASTYMNAHNLSPDFIPRQLANYGTNKNKVLSWIYGYFTNFFEGSAYPDFQDDDIKECSAHPSSSLILTWDNNAPLAWVVGQERYIETQFAGRQKVMAWCEESRGNARLIVDACVDFIARFSPQKGWKQTPIIVNGDAALHSPSVRQSGSGYEEIISTLRQYYDNVFLIASRHNPLQEVRVEAMNKAFSYRKQIISPECKKLISSIQRTNWKIGHSRELSKPSGEDVNSYSDAIGYHITQWVQSEIIASSANPKQSGIKKVIY